MKSISCLAGAALLALGTLLGSCTSNEIDEAVSQENSSSAAITGKIYVGGSSRTNQESILDSISRNGFDAYIYEQTDATSRDEKFVGHVDVELSGSSYTFRIINGDTGETVNWEKGHTFTICAYYVPRNGGYEYGEGIISATDDVDGSADVMVAKASATYTDAVPSLSLSFTHITAQVAATVTAPDDNYDYVVDLIKFTTGEPDGNYDLTASTPAWPAAQAASASEASGASAPELSMYLAGSEGDTGMVSYATKAPYGSTQAVNEKLFAVPCTVADDATNITLTLVYTVYDKDTYGTDRVAVRQAQTEVSKSFKVAAGSNTLYNITVPILPAIGGTVASVGNWVSATSDQTF